MPKRTPHLQTFCAGSIVRIDAHGSKDRVKDASPESWPRSLVPASGACAWWRMPTTFPSSAPFGHPLSSARRDSGRNPKQRTDRPRPSFRRRAAKRDAFQTTRMPFTATTREGNDRGGIAPSGLRAGSLAHAAHAVPKRNGAFEGHCKVTVRSPADFRDGLESTDAF